ncbi:hypothetical protein BRW62_05430 [Parathermosynechococcus lividus PCC 6715]|uniref:Uncharacterized protein n=1 Tax=Parathermosynechococcus lividus PCC 6715 TaxID=1917166 RepID=A0A2D2Q1D2_PARLV|nr:hypothetical protein BRW62_05430 [Thermostichus lividus PCC 6715]
MRGVYMRLEDTFKRLKPHLLPTMFMKPPKTYTKANSAMFWVLVGKEYLPVVTTMRPIECQRSCIEPIQSWLTTDQTTAL